jgi:hypothetical protein
VRCILCHGYSMHMVSNAVQCRAPGVACDSHCIWDPRKTLMVCLNIRCSLSKHFDWDECLGVVEFVMKNSHHYGLRTTLFMLSRVIKFAANLASTFIHTQFLIELYTKESLAMSRG